MINFSPVNDKHVYELLTSLYTPHVTYALAQCNDLLASGDGHDHQIQIEAVQLHDQYALR